MKIKIHTIGKITEHSFLQIAEEYLKRIKWKVEVHEFNHSAYKSLHLNIEKEAEMLWSKPLADFHVACLDPTGVQFSSQQFAEYLEKIGPKICFLIGGSDGHSKNTIARSNSIISLGKMTLPHKLARIVLLEQIYRAYTILIGHPYNK